METIKSIIKKIDRVIPLKETAISLLVCFIALILIEYIWDDSVAGFLNMNALIVAAVLLAYLIVTTILIKYLMRSRRVRQNNIRSLRDRVLEEQDGRSDTVKTVIKAALVLLLVFPIILLTLIAVETIWEGSVSYYINLSALVISTIATEVIAILAILIILGRQSLRMPKQPTEPRVQQESKAERAAEIEKPTATLSAREKITRYGKKEWLLKIARKLLILLLIIIPLLLAIESLWEGSITSYINIKLLIIGLVAVGGLAFWLYRERFLSNIEPDTDELEPDKKRDDFNSKYPSINNLPLVRIIARKMYEEGWNYSIFLLIILVVCFSIRYIYASIGDVNLDEGNGLYSANLILHGSMPFRDYITREPGYMYTLALFVKIFGYSMMTGRLMSIIAGVVICFFIFLIGRELYNKKVGLIAALIYCLAPILIYNDITGYLGTASFMWIPISVYLLILAIKKQSIKYYFLSGLFIGVAFLFYRGLLIYIILCPMALIFIYPHDIKKLFKNTIITVVGLCLPVVPVLLYFVLQTDLNWMLNQYAPPGFITNLAHTVVASGEQTPYIEAKSRILYTLFRGGLYLFIPGLIFLSLLLKKAFKGKRASLSALIGIWAFIIYIVVHGHFIKWYDFGQQPMPGGYPTAFFCLLGLLSLASLWILLNSKLSLDIKTKFRYANIFMIVWWFCASMYFIISPVRMDIGVITITVMAAIAILVLLQDKKLTTQKILPIMFLGLLVMSIIFGGFVYINTPNQDRAIEMSTVREVGQYIEEHTSPDDEILAITMFAVEADRRIIFDILHILIYVPAVDDPTGGYDPYNLTPSTTEITSYMEQYEVKYIVADPRATTLFISERHPDLQDYIIENYTIEKSIDNVDIYKRKDS